MDRDALALLLGQGLSLAEIGERFGRDENTIGYWVKKHGLKPVHAAKHAPRGGLERGVLERLIERGATIREMSAELDVSATTVRYWLTRHGLRTAAASSRARSHAAKADGLAEVGRECPRHGMTAFGLEGRGYYRCLRCRSEQVAKRRRRIKEILVEEAGGKCALCGYDRYIGALEFHHVDPADKRFALATGGLTRSLDAARAEARKCMIVCSNCHAEVEGGVTTVSV